MKMTATLVIPTLVVPPALNHLAQKIPREMTATTVIPAPKHLHQNIVRHPVTGKVLPLIRFPQT